MKGQRNALPLFFVPSGAPPLWRTRSVIPPFSRNREMGMLGQYEGALIEGNTFEANNFSGSPFHHAIYLSGGAAGGNAAASCRAHATTVHALANQNVQPYWRASAWSR